MELWSRVLPSVGVECAGGCWSCGRYHSLGQEEEAKVSSPKPLATHTSPPLVVTGQDSFLCLFPLSSLPLPWQARPRAWLPLQGPHPVCPPPAAGVPHRAAGGSEPGHQRAPVEGHLHPPLPPPSPLPLPLHLGLFPQEESGCVWGGGGMHTCHSV